MAPFIQQAVEKVLNWAELSPIEGLSGQVKRPAKLSFEQKYPKIADHLKLNDQQKLDLSTLLGFSTVGTNEIDLALSRTPSDTEPVQVAHLVSAIIRHFREENPDSDAAAARKLLENSSALSDIDSRLEAARLAQAAAEAEQRALEKEWHQFRSIPAKHEQLTNKVSQLQAERNRLTQTDWDAKIRQLIEIELNPRPGLIVAESVQSLLIQRDTRELRLAVVAGLLEQCGAALTGLTDDNKRLAKTLDLPAHKLG